MSVNKPLPATPGVVSKEPLDVYPIRTSSVRAKQLQCDEHELSKRLSVALFANKSAFSRPLQVNHPLSPEDQPCGLSAMDDDTKPPEGSSSEPCSQKQQQPPRHPPVALSYYNSRLAPIQRKEVQPTSYHGVYQGVPLVDEVIPVTWKPWEVDGATTDDGHRPAAKAATYQSVLTPVSAVPVPTPYQAVPTPVSAVPVPTPTPTAKAGGKTAETVTARVPEQEVDLTRQKGKAGRAQSSRSRKQSSVAHGAQPTRRPLTSMQEVHAKHYTEWRDIHVQSLSRVDSILREAVGLRPSNPSRWSAYASPHQGPEDPASPPHSGLGISVSQNTSTSAFGAPPPQPPSSSDYYSPSRPNTASAYLSTPTSKPSSHLDSYQYSQGSAAQIADATTTATARPARSRTASSLSRPHGDTRGTSMYLANQAPRPATTHGMRRQMSMCSPSVRQLRLSRDEARRSRLFAEYEMLMATRGSGEDDDDDDDDTATIDEIDDDAVLVGMPMECGQGSLDDISEDAEYEFANYEPSPVDEVVIRESRKDDDKEAPRPQPQLTPLVDKRKPIYAARPRPATVFGLSGPTLREVRDNQATSMYSSSVDIVSKRLAEKRWSRTIIQNQHLFRAQTIAEQMDLEPAFGDGEDDADRAAASDLEASPPPPPLQLDLQAGIDLYQDVTQALAACQPPHSARSTTSTSSSSAATTMAFPLTGAQFLSLQADAAFGAPTFTEKKSTRSRQAKDKKDGDNNHNNSSSLGASDDGSSAAADAATTRSSAKSSSPHGSGSSATEKKRQKQKRESIYINSEDLFDSAILAEAELPYQQEHGAAAAAAGVEEYTPTIAASSLSPDNDERRLHISINFDTDAVTELDDIMASIHLDGLDDLDVGIESEFTTKFNDLDVGIESEFTAKFIDLDVGEYNRNSLAAPLSAPAAPSRTAEHSVDSPRPSAVKSSTTECVSEASPRPKIGARHSEIVRQQLRFVEGHTPATKLGTELSKSDDEHRQMLEAYMKRFDFCSQPIDFALRQLFQELHLPGEAQQIDRVITSFAGWYHQCNPGLFCSADIVYAHAFAILLLHTDAHNPKVRHKISKAQFVARAKLLDERGPGQANEMFDEVLDILYDNVTMVKFEYGPTTAATARAAAAAQRPATSQGIGARDQAPGLSGWLRRVFAPASAPSAPSKSPLSPQDIPSKEQYSYSSLPRRRFAPVGLGPTSPVVGVSGPQLPPTPTISRPSTAHGMASRSSSSSESVGSYEYDERMVAASSAPSVNIPQISPLAADFAMTYSAPILGEDGGKGEGKGDAILLGRISSTTFYTPPSDGALATAQDAPRPTTARPFRSSPLAASIGASPGRLTHIPSSPESDGGEAGGGPHLGLSLSTTFAAADVAASAQPMVVETIRLSGVKSHVKRRVSLRQGRPLSGIIYQKPSPPAQRQHPEVHHAVIGCAATAGSSISAAVVAAAAAAAAASSALLRVDMAGRVARKMERLDSGRRGLVRRWKDVWMVLSGSRLYFFRPSDASSHARPAMSVQTIVPLRGGVAIVDAAYKKYPHVFRILAGDGCQVLVKAPDDDAVAEWMARINCAAAFKTTEVERRNLLSVAQQPSDQPSEKPSEQSSEQRARLLEAKLAALDDDLNQIDDRLERCLRLFKQLVAMVPLTRHGRTRAVQYASAARERLKELYVSEQRLTCYKDVLELDLAIEYELVGYNSSFSSL